MHYGVRKQYAKRPKGGGGKDVVNREKSRVEKLTVRIGLYTEGQRVADSRRTEAGRETGAIVLRLARQTECGERNHIGKRDSASERGGGGRRRSKICSIHSKKDQR